MKYSVVFTAKKYEEIEADSKEKAEEIALAMQEDVRGELKFEAPFAMLIELPNNEDVEKAYNEFKAKYPDFEPKLKECREAMSSVFDLAKKQYNEAREKTEAIFESIDKEVIKEFGELLQNYGLSNGFNGGDAKAMVFAPIFFGDK